MFGRLGGVDHLERLSLRGVAEGSADRLHPHSFVAQRAPLMLCRSVPQMVVNVTRTTASPGACSTGFGLSARVILPGPS